MLFPRSSGILLHPTSFPGAWGIGDLGAAAYRFIDFLHAAGQQLWQILPLGPTGYGDSPYQAGSAFAGNPLLVSPERLRHEGLLTDADLSAAAAEVAGVSPDRADYDRARAVKLPLLRRALERMQGGAAPDHAAGFKTFCAAEAGWLDDYALFAALRDHHPDMSWDAWPRPIALREPAAIAEWQTRLAAEIELQKFYQYLFFNQWLALKAYANERGIRIIGDAPIFVAFDSADVWANPRLFFLDDAGRPTVVAGVPPDYFSATGQLWGNPLYRWDRMAADNYAWWVARLRMALTQVDLLRLDHFRGFEAYWEVPATERTAVHGRWVLGPGADFFTKVRAALGELPLIAEDLGLITPEVEALRDQFSLSGMKVLQFAFGGGHTNPYLPHNYGTNFVVYTGTHDNDTTIGWFANLSDVEREAAQRYLGRSGADIAWELMRVALMSVADMAVFPLQDILRLGNEARMNIPGTETGNWSWRYRAEMLNHGLADGLHSLTATYGRAPREEEDEE